MIKSGFFGRYVHSKKGLFQVVTPITLNNGQIFRESAAGLLTTTKNGNSRRSYSQGSGRKSDVVTYYDILGVDHKATQKQIRDAYIQLSKTYHPDVNIDPKHASKFSQISHAYELLSNPKKRRNYDREHFFHTVHHEEVYEDESGERRQNFFTEQHGYREFGKNVGPPVRLKKNIFESDKHTQNILRMSRLMKKNEIENVVLYEKILKPEQDGSVLFSQQSGKLICALLLLMMCWLTFGEKQ